MFQACDVSGFNFESENPKPETVKGLEVQNSSSSRAEELQPVLNPFVSEPGTLSPNLGFRVNLQCLTLLMLQRA